jgi:uncharacterized OB-fold protein
MTDIFADIHPDADHAAFLAAGRFMIQRSRGTGAHVYYPRVALPGRGDADLEWVEPSGLGTVYSTTTVRNRAPVPDYNVSLIDLDEGVRMMGRVVGSDAVAIGMRVRGRVGEIDGVPAVLFDMLGDEA